MYTAKIGNEDITGVIHNAIAISKRDGRAGAGKVGAVGVFNCQIEPMGDDTGRVKWSISGTPTRRRTPSILILLLGLRFRRGNLQLPEWTRDGK